MAQHRIQIVAIASFMLVSMLNQGVQAQRFFQGRQGNQVRIESRFNTVQENFLGTIGLPFGTTYPADFDAGTYSTPLYVPQSPGVTIESGVQADFITQGNLDPLYDHGFSSHAGMSFGMQPLFNEIEFELILRAVKRDLDARDININPTPGLNRVPDGNGSSVGGVVGFRFEVPFVNSVPNFNPEWSRFLVFESAVGVGQVQQKLRQQTFNPMYPSITLGNIEPKTSAAYVDGVLALGLGVLNNDWKFVANVSYIVRGTDLILNEWGTTTGVSVGISAEISPRAVGSYLLRGRTRNFQAPASF